MSQVAILREQRATLPLPDSRKTPSSGKVRGGLAVLGFVIPIGLYFWLIHHYGVNVVFLDQWGDVGIVRHSYTGNLTLGTLWSQHGEQRLLFPNLIVLALAYTTHLNIVFEQYLSAILLSLSSFLLVLSHKRRSSRGWIWYCPVPILMLSLVQSKSTLFGFQLAWYLLILMLAVALYLLDRPTLSGLAVAGAMVAAVVGSFSSLPGLLIWPAGLILLYQRRCRLSLTIGWCLAAVAAGAVYLYHYDSGTEAPPHMSGFDLPGLALRAFFEVIGGVLGIHLTNASGGAKDLELLFGVVLFLIATYAVVTRGFRRDVSSGAPVGIALICFGLLYALGFAYGRGWAGGATATASQYTTFTLLIVTGTYLALLDPSDRSIAFLGARVSRVVMSVLVGAICIQVVLGTTSGLRVASSFHQQQIQAATVLVDVRQVPNPIMQTDLGSWWLPPSVVRSYASTLERHHLSVFGSKEFPAYRQQALAQQKAGAFTYTPPPPPLVLNPHVVKTVKGSVVLDFLAPRTAHPISVDVHLVSGLQDVSLGPAAQTAYGWLLEWNTTGVRNGTYQIQTILHGDHGVAKSAPVTVVIDNP